MHPERGTFFQRQTLPILLTGVAFAFVCALIFGEVSVLNLFTKEDISRSVHIADVLIGLTVYAKTSIDFAIFIGNLMQENPGWRSRISIQFGTTIGNALGTALVLLIWVLFKEIDWLLAIMIVLAAMVLFKLAEDGLEHAAHTDREYPLWFKKVVHVIEVFLKHVNWFTRPVLRFILPEIKMDAHARGNLSRLFVFSITIPFLLGLDDFAGYVPLFSVVNVFGFTVGVFAAHALLNTFLFLSPERTTKVVKNPIISLLGSIAFVGLGAWGLYEAAHLLFAF